MTVAMGLNDGEGDSSAQQARDSKLSPPAQHAVDCQNKKVATLRAAVLLVILAAVLVVGGRGAEIWPVLAQQLSMITGSASASVASATGHAAPVSPPVTGSRQPLTTPASRSHDDPDQACWIVATQPVETTTQPVYRWKDDNGVWNFSDKSPAAAAGVVDVRLDRVIQQQTKFTISVDARRASMPPFLQDRIRTSAAAIYQFLATPMPVELIRQADIRVHLIGDQAEFFKAYGKLMPGQLAPSGFYTSKSNEAFVLANRDHRQTQATAIHETSHVIMAALYQRTPVWLNEGVAEYFEVLPTSAIDRRYQPKPEWLRALRQQGLMSIGTLLTLTREQWQQMPAARSYANAWVVVYHMMQTSAGRQTLFQLLTTIRRTPCQSISSVEVVERSYPGGIKGLQAEITTWLLSHSR